MKKFVNFRFVVTLVLAVFANVVTYAQDNVVDEVVWVVGDEAILKSDVEEARMDAPVNAVKIFGVGLCDSRRNRCSEVIPASGKVG